MKNLVCTALLLGGLTQATGCIIESSDDDDTGVIHAEWNLVERLASSPPANNAITCDDAGVVTIAVHSLPESGLDCDTVIAGDECIDLFDCIDGNEHTAPLFADNYTVWVDALDANGDLIAQSFSTVPTPIGGGEDTGIIFTFPVDVGNFDLTWSLVDDLTNDPITCADAGAAGGISIITTLVSNTSTFTENLFDCEDAGGLAIDNILGEQTVVVSILDADDLSLGDSEPRNETLAIGNEVIDLGNFEFAFQ